jgi:hypothetical protein
MNKCWWLLLALALGTELMAAPGEEPAELSQAELVEARQILSEAKTLAERIVAEARREAALLRASTPDTTVTATPEMGSEPLAVMNGRVRIHLQAGTVEEIANALMPAGWRVLVDVPEVELAVRRFQFVSSKPRDQALNDLLAPLGLQHQYFFDLIDGQGKAAPLLVISRKKAVL